VELKEERVARPGKRKRCVCMGTLVHYAQTVRSSWNGNECEAVSSGEYVSAFDAMKKDGLVDAKGRALPLLPFPPQPAPLVLVYHCTHALAAFSSLAGPLVPFSAQTTQVVHGLTLYPLVL